MVICFTTAATDTPRAFALAATGYRADRLLRIPAYYPTFSGECDQKMNPQLSLRFWFPNTAPGGHHSTPSSPLYSFSSSPSPPGNREMNDCLDPALTGSLISTRRLPAYPVALGVQSRCACVSNSASRRPIPVYRAAAAPIPGKA